MICKKCAIAGDMVAEARSMNLGLPISYLVRLNENDTDFDVSLREAVRSVAIVFHGLCKGSTHCDCQHKIDFEGKVIKNGKKAGKSSSEDRKSSRKASRRDSRG